jgi:hypothetical protein
MMRAMVVGTDADRIVASGTPAATGALADIETLIQTVDEGGIVIAISTEMISGAGGDKDLNHEGTKTQR